MKSPYLLLSPLTAYFVVFLLVPVAMVLNLSVSPGLTLENFSAVMDIRYLEVFGRSVAYAGMAAAIALLLAYPLAWWIAMYGGTRKNLWIVLVMLPFWTSFLIRIYSWKALLASKGLVNLALMSVGLIDEPLQLLNTPATVVLGLVYGYLPFMTLPIYVSLEKLDRTLLDAAGDLGASAAATFMRVVLPLSLPGVAAGCILTFIPAVGDFVTPDLLGGPQTQMIGNVIESKFFPEQDWPVGAAIACVLMAVLMLALLLYVRRAGEEELA